MRRIAILTAFAALMVPSVALAQSSSSSGYAPQAAQAISPTSATTATTAAGTTSASTSPTATTTSSSSTLPFTGLDVVLLVVGGGALVSAGFVVRKLSHRLN